MGNKKYNVVIVQMDSESELRDYINQREGVMLGEQTENPSKYYQVELDLYGEECTIGILNGGHGIEPQVKIIEPELIITSNHMLYIFNVKTRTITNTLEFDSLIYDVIIPQNTEAIIVVCELDVGCITNKGSTIWSWQSDDIIIDYTLKDDVITVITEEMEQKLSLKTGDTV